MMANGSQNFFLRDKTEHMYIADLLVDVPYLTLKERNMFSLAPMPLRVSVMKEAERFFAN